MPNQYRSILSDQQQANSLPGRFYLSLARWIIFVERHGHFCWRFYAVAGIVLATIWFGLFEVLPLWLHIPALVIGAAALLFALRDTGPGWRWPSEAAAARRLEEDSRLAHRPFEALLAHPAAPLEESSIRGLWKQHQARARVALTRLRLPRLRLARAGSDRGLLLYVAPVMVVASAIFGWGQLGPRVVQALTVPDVRSPYTGAPPVMLDAWITPPAYTHLPPVMLAQSESGALREGVVQVPAGSTMALRINLGPEAEETPPLLRTDADADMPFKATGDGGFTLDGPVPETHRFDVRRGWWKLAGWRLDALPDRAPEIGWQETPKVSGHDVVLDFVTHDDYGIARLNVVLDLAVSAPGLSSGTRRIALSGAGQKAAKIKTPLDLTTTSWAGMPVTLRIEAVDQIDQVTSTTTATLTLPERKFDNPVAKILVAARKKLMSNPNGAWIETSNLMAGIANNPPAYRGDYVVLLALRSVAMRMHLDQQHTSLTPVAETIWQVALRLETGGLVAAQDALRAAQQALEDALSSEADPETVRQLTQQLGQAMAQYMQALSENLAETQGEIPPELMDEAEGRDIVADIVQKMQQIQDLSATGAREAAQQKLQELQKMLQDLAQAKPMTPEQMADMADFKELKNLIDKQQKLKDATAMAEHKPGSADGEALARDQDSLRENLGEIVRSLAERHADMPPQLATADQNMKGATQDIQNGAWPEAQSKQGKALAALKELSKSMQQQMKKMQVLRMPMRREGQKGARPDPFAQPGPTDSVEDDGSIKVPPEQKVKRAREILDELRRRSGDYGRPQEERDYIDRLLNSF
ncbi:MAG: DUF4175 family protein [Alphaproteobacteria bacterium]